MFDYVPVIIGCMQIHPVANSLLDWKWKKECGLWNLLANGVLPMTQLEHESATEVAIPDMNGIMGM